MADFSLELLRPEDLLALEFTFLNLTLDTPPGQPPRLTRASGGRPALVIIRLGSQHLAEKAFAERLDGDLQDPGSFPIPSVMADSSRLVFQLPDAMPFLPLTVKDLLDWEKLLPVVPANALPDPPGPHAGPAVAAPTSQQTAIEVPYGVVLSPDRSGRWTHAVGAVTHAGRTELWHTQLRVRAAGPNADAGGDAAGSMTTIRAVSAAHGSVDFVPLFGGHAFETSPNASQRQAIAQLSSDFAVQNRPAPLSATHLMLSRLGAWTDLSGAWDVPTIADLTAWHHVVCMGRDQFVRLTGRGVLCPFGHRAALVATTERKFKPSPSGEPTAYLATRTGLLVQEPERFYDQRDFPFRSVRITGPFSPDLDPPPPGGGAFVPHVGGQPLAFAIIATDWQGQTVGFDAPLVFAPLSSLSDLDAIAALYASVSRVDVRGQPIAYAPPQAADTALKTSTIRFGQRPGAGALPFTPVLESADVRIPAADQLQAAGSSADATMRYHAAYVAAGAGVTQGVFATIDDGLRLAFPADVAGGFAAPAVTLSGLSNAHGAVPNAAALASNQFDELVEGLEGQLLGLIDLRTVIAAVTDAGELPTLKTSVNGDRVTTSFTWNPSLKSTLPAPLRAVGRAGLAISGTQVRRLGQAGAHTIVDGTLTNIGLQLSGILNLDFRSIRFHQETGQKTAFTLDVSNFEFTGDLAFVNALTSALPSTELKTGAGPTVRVLPDGVSVGIGVAIPSVALGAMSLQNVALSAMVTLYFFGGRPIEITFALSSRRNPFLVSYSIFGGGGFFALTVKSNGDVDAEAAFEFGAVAAIDLVLAKGIAQIMAGILFKKAGTQITLGGYVRIHGSLEVLQIVSVSVDFYLQLTYVAPEAVGEASLVVMVRVLGFSESVSLTVRRSFSTAPPGNALLTRSFGEALAESDWRDYCLAFA